ncbi:MAG TPA: alpha/beta fold hydrolase [Chitinophagaceae bacterium]|nr:alpha/beta fold hydrolase [Chitinophagaceae bacterium]
MMKLVQKIAVGYIRKKFSLLSAISPRKTAEQAFKLFSTPQRRTRGPLPAIFTEAEKLHFDFEGYHIAGYRWNKDAGRRVLIIHGFESSVINFERYVQPLLQKGYEVLAFDAPAHGRSSGKQVNAVVFSNFILHIHEHYGPVHSFMAHSFGGLCLCIALAEMKPDNDRRVVLIAPATETATAINKFFHFTRLRSDKVRKEFDNIITRVGGQPAAWFSIGRTLDHIPGPVLWFHDENDQITPLSDALKIKERNLPNIRFVITKGLGHSRIYRDEEVRKEVVGFL